MTTIDYERVNTHQLRVGDTILNHGMVLRLTEQLHHDTRPGVLAFSSDITNWDTLDQDASPELARFIRSVQPDRRWTVQGNQLANWYRVTE